MATLRALLVLSEAGDVVFSRKWPTVERRAKLLYGAEYEPIPSDSDLKAPLMGEIRRNDLTSFPGPVIALKNGRLWPLVFINKASAFILAVPLVEGWLALPTSVSSNIGLVGESEIPRHLTAESLREIQKRPLLDLPFITGTVTILETVAEFVAPHAPRFEQNKMAELHATINKFIQFGRAIDTDVATIKALSQIDFPKQDALADKRPAWKPISFKGRNRIEVAIVEKIHATQYDRDAVPDTWNVYGRLQVKAETEGHPEVSITLGKEAATRLSLPHFHQSVTNIADAPHGMQITFNPPLGPVSVFKYNIDSVERLPIRGFYQMKPMSSSHVKVLVQLKINDPAANQFEFCQVELPFPSRNNITSFELQPTIGNVFVDLKRKNTLIWNIGGKFSGKNLEAALPGLIFFDEAPLATPSEDPFCSGPNGYVKVSFKIPEYSLSGLSVSSNNITVNPKQSVKKSIAISRYLESGDYVIWNSLGDVRIALSPEAPSVSGRISSQAQSMKLEISSGSSDGTPTQASPSSFSSSIPSELSGALDSPTGDSDR